VLLPVMICMDGFVLTHSYEAIELISQEEADKFLTPYKPDYFLTPDKPVTMGAMVGPEAYMETRYQVYEGMQNAAKVIEDVADEFKNRFGRHYGGLTDSYKLEDADIAIVSLGSVIGTIKDAVDILREKGKKVGVLKIRTYRPFPKDEIYDELQHVKKIYVIEKAVAIGMGGIVSNDVRAVFYGKTKRPKICGCICGLGGRDITIDTIRNILKDKSLNMSGDQFIELKRELIEDVDISDDEALAATA
ncbi:MAG: transketolase C-terminal domain-containing protein, partial [Candidatus Anammoxibacter sp.]